MVSVDHTENEELYSLGEAIDLAFPGDTVELEPGSVRELSCKKEHPEHESVRT